MKRFLTIASLAALAAFAPARAEASIIFLFTESGGTVQMTSSGTLDTSKLVLVSRPDGWGNTGTEHNGTPGDIDIMGGTLFGPIDLQFGFHAGTDASAITNPGGPFAFSFFAPTTILGSKSFTTYSGFNNAGLREPGIGIVRIDLDGALWTPDQNWTYAAGSTFASLGMIAGTYAVSDIDTGETITIQIGGQTAIPEPATMLLLGSGLAAAAVRRRINRRA